LAYAVFRFLQFRVEGSRRGGWIQALVGGLAVLTVLGVLASLQYTDLGDFLLPIFWFWVLAGVLGAVAARLAAPGLVRTLETAIGVLGALCGLVAGWLVEEINQHEGAGAVLIVWSGLLGVLLVSIGLLRARDSAAAQPVVLPSRRDPIPAAAIIAGVAILIGLALARLGELSDDARNVVLGVALGIHGAFRLIQSAADRASREGGSRRAPWLALMGVMSLVTACLVVAYGITERGSTVPTPLAVAMFAVGTTQAIAARWCDDSRVRAVEIVAAVIGLIAGLVQAILIARVNDSQIPALVWMIALAATLLVVGLQRGTQAVTPPPAAVPGG
jgi:hypothetical protein